MPALTAVVLAAFVAYCVAWWQGAIEGNFTVLLFAAVVVAGVYWVLEKAVFAPRRRREAAALEASIAERLAQAQQQGIAADVQALEQRKSKALEQPWWLDWTAGLFPVLAVVFLLRSFAFEPFKIPSGSMVPTLLIGDYIVVNKFTYGLKLPILNVPLTQGKPVARGDVVVFRYPPKPSVDFIKRVIGLPGDEVAYLNKQLTINGAAVPNERLDDYLDRDVSQYFQQFRERLGEHPHAIIVDPKRAAFIGEGVELPQEQKKYCQYSVEGVRCRVPDGQYFVMGDNRDNSLDSRYWGFVPERNIVGKAVFIWMNLGNWGRIGVIQ